MLKDIQVTGNKDTRSGFGDGVFEFVEVIADGQLGGHFGDRVAGSL